MRPRKKRWALKDAIAAKPDALNAVESVASVISSRGQSAEPDDDNEDEDEDKEDDIDDEAAQ